MSMGIVLKNHNKHLGYRCIVEEQIAEVLHEVVELPVESEPADQRGKAAHLCLAGHGHRVEWG